jgi:acetyl-CoA carboxylase biotin carboxyl carrier protein
MIDAKNLKALVRLMVDNDLTELELHDAQGERVSLKRGGDHAAPPAAGPSPVVSPRTAGATNPTPAPAAQDGGLVPITSPIVGTFYAAATPDAKPFVSVGDRVTTDSVVCIIEAMKVFNEIKADAAGTIAKVLVAGGRAVEFGQPLFLVRPD